MTNLLNYKHRVLVFSLIAVATALLSIGLVIQVIKYSNALQAEESIQFQHFLNFLFLVMATYVFISATVCFAVLIWKDLKPLNEDGLIMDLIRGSAWGLTFSFIMNPVLSPIMGPIIGGPIVAGPIWGLIWGLFMGLGWGLTAEFRK